MNTTKKNDPVGMSGGVPMGTVVSEVLADLVAKGFLTPEQVDEWYKMSEQPAEQKARGRRAMAAAGLDRHVAAFIDRRMGVPAEGAAPLSRDPVSGRLTFSAVAGPVRMPPRTGKLVIR
jgi:hypothetical protein